MTDETLEKLARSNSHQADLNFVASRMRALAAKQYLPQGSIEEFKNYPFAGEDWADVLPNITPDKRAALLAEALQTTEVVIRGLVRGYGGFHWVFNLQSAVYMLALVFIPRDRVSLSGFRREIMGRVVNPSKQINALLEFLYNKDPESLGAENIKELLRFDLLPRSAMVHLPEMDHAEFLEIDLGL